jgi:hypothetical protein
MTEPNETTDPTERTEPGGVLERRYRRVLRLLPTQYRREWEEDMVAAFLASMHTDDPDRADYLAEFGRPTWSEVASVATLAVRLRLGLAGATTPYAVAWTTAVRTVVLAWLLAGAVFGTVGVVTQLWLLGAVTWLPGPAAEWVVPWPADAWHLAWGFAAATWPIAFLALVLGWTALARGAALLGVLHLAVQVVQAMTEVARGIPIPVVAPLLTLLLDLGLLALLWTVRAPVRVHATPWLVAFVVGLAIEGVVVAGQVTSVVPWPLLDPPGVVAVAIAAIAVAHVVAWRLGRRPVDASVALAVALGIGVAIAYRLTGLADLIAAASWMGTGPVTVTATEVVALAAIGVPVLRYAARATAGPADLAESRA